MTVLQSLPINGLVIVSSPQNLVQMVVNKAVKMAKQMQIPILGLVENMSEYICPQCGEALKIFGESQGSSVADNMGIDFLGSLPWDTRLNQLVDKGEVEEYYSEELAGIIEKIVARMEN